LYRDRFELHCDRNGSDIHPGVNEVDQPSVWSCCCSSHDRAQAIEVLSNGGSHKAVASGGRYGAVSAADNLQKRIGWYLVAYSPTLAFRRLHSGRLYMHRDINLRQIEAFKAVIESGTVSRAAQMLNMSQPAMSKLIAHLEFDTGLRLFDRVKGRLAPTENAMRLYEEVGRIFAGVRQVENAVEAIRREEQGRLSIGVMPTLAGSFVQRATMGFLTDRRNVFCSVQSLTSQWIVDWLIARKLDVGLVSANIVNPYVTLEPIMEHPLVCIMPLDHPLAAKNLIEPADLDEIPFVAFLPDTDFGHLVDEMFQTHGVSAQVALVANVAPTLCEFVAAGLGVSLVHPLMVSGFEQRVVARRFAPEIEYHFQLCRSSDSRNARLVDAFAQEVRATAAQISCSMLGELEA
jgi:DNA-binding transcriptional LysR family regulator